MTISRARRIESAAPLATASDLSSLELSAIDKRQGVAVGERNRRMDWDTFRDGLWPAFYAGWSGLSIPDASVTPLDFSTAVKLSRVIDVNAGSGVTLDLVPEDGIYQVIVSIDEGSADTAWAKTEQIYVAALDGTGVTTLARSSRSNLTVALGESFSESLSMIVQVDQTIAATSNLRLSLYQNSGSTLVADVKAVVSLLSGGWLL